MYVQKEFFAFNATFYTITIVDFVGTGRCTITAPKLDEIKNEAV